MGYHKKNSYRYSKKCKDCNCFECTNALYIGEGDYVCDCMQVIVIEDFSPSDNFRECRGEYFEKL